MEGSRSMLVVLLWFLVIGFVNADTCATNLTLNNLIPFQTASLHCYSVWSSQDFILRYFQSGPNLWSFVLSAPDTNSYISIGFSSNGRMVGTSAITGWVPSGGPGIVKQYYLGGYGVIQVAADQGSLTIANNSTAMISQSSRLYMAFQLATAQPETRLIYAVGPSNRFPSSSNYRLAQHKTYTATTMNYGSATSSGGNSGGGNSGGEGDDDYNDENGGNVNNGNGQVSSQSSSSRMKKTHGILNMVGWGIMMPIGAIIARYCKHWDPLWFYSHVSIQFTAFVLGIAGIITGFDLEDVRGGSDVDKHKALGIFMLVFGCLQVMALLARPGKGSKVRKYWNWYHYSVGRFLFICAIGNIFYGIHIGNEDSSWNVGYGILLICLVVITIVLEIRMWMRK